MKYTIHPGRSIHRNDKSFVYINRHTLKEDGAVIGYSCAPEEADTFARTIPNLIEAARDLVGQVTRYCNEGVDLPDVTEMRRALKALGVFA